MSTRVPLRHRHASQLRFSLLLLILAAALGFATACGSGGGMSGPSGPTLTGNTAVTVVLSGTANDQLTEFDLELQGLTLTSQSGKSVNLLLAQQPSEFVHLNGGLDVLTTVTIPQDVYTSATAAVGGAQFTCVTQTPAGPDGPSIDISTYAYGYTPTGQVSVNVASPITVTGASMIVALDLQALQSASYSSCYPSSTFAIDPTFNLALLTLASQPTNAGNGKLSGIEGEIASINTDGSGFTLLVSEGPFGTRTLSVTSGAATVFQGIGGFSALSAGMFVNMDAGLQTDGSLAATRIAVDDPLAVNILTGPLLQVDSGVPDLLVYGRLEQGPLLSLGGQSGIYAGAPYIDFSDAVFQISGQQSNLQTLPFSAEFNAANMVAGQNVDVTTPNLIVTGGVYTPANTITLIPQTIDASVASSTTSGAFTIYSVVLAPYDLFPTLADQPGQTTLLNNPSEVEVYVDNNTQLLNTQPLAPGSTLRFYGLVFNDSGTLRMDCAQVNDGVAFSASSSALQQSRMKTGAVQQLRSASAGSLPATVHVITRQP